MEKINKINIIFLVSIFLFCSLSLFKMLNHFPWADEAHAWLIAGNMNFDNVIKYLSEEGHLIIWYLILMPFAKLDLGYPYSMQFINWLIYLAAIIFMWKKADFNIFIKLIITFSWISLNYYSVVARCYSIGILGLFIICYLYNKQMEKPILYASVLALTAHTSLLSTFAVIPFGIIFLYNLITSKKTKTNKYIISCVILLVAAIIWIAPFIFGYGSTIEKAYSNPSFISIVSFYSQYHYLFGLVFILTWIISFIFADNKIKFWIFTVTIEYLFFFSYVYSISAHLFVYLFIYLILALWLTPKLHDIKKVSIIYMILFGILLLTDQEEKFSYIVNNPDKRQLINHLNKQPDKGHIYLTWDEFDIKPLLKKDFQWHLLQFKYDTLCFKDDICAKEYIENDLKDLKHYTAYTVTDVRVNTNSILFYDVYHNVKLYLTKFKK